MVKKTVWHHCTVQNDRHYVDGVESTKETFDEIFDQAVEVWNVGGTEKAEWVKSYAK